MSRLAAETALEKPVMLDKPVHHVATVRTAPRIHPELPALEHVDIALCYHQALTSITGHSSTSRVLGAAGLDVSTRCAALG